MKHKIVAVALAAALALCTAACTAAPEKEELQTLTVSEVAHSVFYAPQYVALELGFF